MRDNAVGSLSYAHAKSIRECEISWVSRTNLSFCICLCPWSHASMLCCTASVNITSSSLCISGQWTWNFNSSAVLITSRLLHSCVSYFICFVSRASADFYERIASISFICLRRQTKIFWSNPETLNLLFPTEFCH